MTLEAIQQDSPPAGEYLGRVLKELQGLSFSVVAGAAANTSIAVTGLGANDTLVAVLEITSSAEADATPAVIDRSATTTIYSAGNIRSTDATNTDADRRLIVVWFNKP